MVMSQAFRVRAVIQPAISPSILIDLHERGNASRKIYLTTNLAPPYELTALFMHIRKATSAATDVPMLAGRAAEDECMWGNIACHHRACTDQGKFTYGHTTEDDRTCTNRRAILHQGRCHLPIPGIFELAVRSNGAGKQVVGETDTRAHKNAVFQCHTFIHQGIVLDLDARTNTDMCADVYALSDVALLPDVRVFPYLHLAPDACPCPDMGVG